MELKLQNLTKTYGKTVALSTFSYTFHEGIYGILGANGAGKSTLMNLITDNVRRDHGSIELDGIDILELGSTYREMLGYMPQQQGLYEGMTPEMFLSYLARLKGIPKQKIKTEITRVLNMTNLAEAKHDAINTFSGGMKQRVLLAQALLGDPRLLILDEPTAGLDPEERIRLRGNIAELAKERIVLLATHIVSDIEAIANDILLLKAGKLIIHGTAQHLIDSVPLEKKPLAGRMTLEDVYLHYLGEARHE